MKPKVHPLLLGRDRGWYVINEADSHVMRGPYRHGETAGAVRQEIELRATDRQLELWNLVVAYSPKQKGTE